MQVPAPRMAASIDDFGGCASVSPRGFPCLVTASGAAHTDNRLIPLWVYKFVINFRRVRQTWLGCVKTFMNWMWSETKYELKRASAEKKILPNIHSTKHLRAYTTFNKQKGHSRKNIMQRFYDIKKYDLFEKMYDFILFSGVYSLSFTYVNGDRINDLFLQASLRQMAPLS